MQKLMEVIISGDYLLVDENGIELLIEVDRKLRSEGIAKTAIAYYLEWLKREKQEECFPEGEVIYLEPERDEILNELDLYEALVG